MYLILIYRISKFRIYTEQNTVQSISPTFPPSFIPQSWSSQTPTIKHCCVLYVLIYVYIHLYLFNSLYFPVLVEAEMGKGECSPYPLTLCAQKWSPAYENGCIYYRRLSGCTEMVVQMCHIVDSMWKISQICQTDDQI